MNKKNKIKGNGFQEIKEILNQVGIKLDRVAIDLEKLKISQEMTDKQLKKTDEQIRETEQLVNRTNKQVGELTDSWGKFVEGLVTPSVPKLFSKFGIKIIGIDQRALRRLNGREFEIDVLCPGKRGTKEIVIAAEVKSTLKIEDVKNYLDSLGNFFKFFTEYKGRELMAVVSGIKMEKGVAEFAEKQGLYVLIPSDDTMRLYNKKGFKPRIWR